ncbi:MAG: class I SAM-dependent methyltransferase [Candidatus Methylomirabilales bacterium]
MTDRWARYISKSIEEQGGLFQAALCSWQYAAPLADAIRRAVPPSARILEVGCGAAFLSIYLHHLGYKVTAIDEDSEVLKLAREIAEFFHATPPFTLGAAADLGPYHGQFDLTFSEGVVEHYPRETTVALLREQARCSPAVLASIPTRHTRWIPGATDDARFYSLGGLKSMMRDAGLRVVDSGAFCDLQSPLSIWLSRLMPLPLYRWTQRTFTLAMSVYCLGRVPDERC